MAKHEISAVPVPILGRHVAGVVSEANLLSVLDKSRHLKRLPVIDASGKLIGIVSRCDPLSVFLRSDEDIGREVREMLSQILLADPANVTVRVRNGIVTLAGQLGSAEQHELIRVAVPMTWDVDGVVNVVNKLGAIQPITPPNLP